MEISFLPLAVVSGFWGQLLEYWPLTLLIILTIAYVSVAVVYDWVFRRHRSPAGAQPRMEITTDPSSIARGRMRTAFFLVRMGTTGAFVVSGIVTYLAFFPLSIGEQYGLTQQSNDATAVGAVAALIAGAVAVGASVFVRNLPIPLIALIALMVVVAVIAPSVSNGQLRWLGIMAFVLSIPSILVFFGALMAVRNVQDATPRAPAPAGTSPV